MRASFPFSAATGRPPAPAQALLPKTGRGLRAPALLGALVLSLVLAGCEADHVGARATLQDWGYTGVAIFEPPTFGRPCRWGQPYAVRFTAHDASGALKGGWLCATDESANDGLIVLDSESAR